jgi:hypothetical protein
MESPKGIIFRGLPEPFFVRVKALAEVSNTPTVATVAAAIADKVLVKIFMVRVSYIGRLLEVIGRSQVELFFEYDAPYF